MPLFRTRHVKGELGAKFAPSGMDRSVTNVELSVQVAPALPTVGVEVDAATGALVAAPLQLAQVTSLEPLFPSDDGGAAHAQFPGNCGLRQLAGSKQASAFQAAFFQLFAGEGIRLPCHTPIVNQFL